ncbi:predicted GPI-anchored protein 58, partial [Ananas comosus]|uniref:Predicted GPI-anchored protein 58 n=1 Tax=Ananas comosus TaxID=4615 RepID=A0A6P5EKA2_ANACO
MASAVVNNVAISPEGFLPSYGWLSPRVSFSRDLSPSSAADATAAPSPETPDLEASAGEMEFIDFEFRLEDPVAMLPADELFADGKLVPLRLAAAPTPPAAAEQAANAAAVGEVGAAPELLGLRRSRTTPTKPDRDKPSSSPSAAASRSPNPNPNPNPNPSPGASRSLKHLLHRGAAARSGGAIEPSLSLPLLRDSDSESLSISSRLSLSSSSSSGGPDHDDLPRLSLDSDKPPRVRLLRP